VKQPRAKSESRMPLLGLEGWFIWISEVSPSPATRTENAEREEPKRRAPLGLGEPAVPLQAQSWEGASEEGEGSSEGASSSPSVM
jgi:hypothetical protein